MMEKRRVKLKDLKPEHFYDRILYHAQIETLKHQIQQMGVEEFLKTYRIRIRSDGVTVAGNGWLAVLALKESDIAHINHPQPPIS